MAILLLSLTACAVRPKPIGQGAFAMNAESNILRLDEEQDQVTGLIDLGEAMARAFKYNLDLRLKEKQASLAQAEHSLQQDSMFPKTVLSSGYFRRSNTMASSSLDLITNNRDSNPSTSQDRGQLSSDITIGWDILDFGMSYIRAQQSADEVLIAHENRRDTLRKLMEEVRTQYWRASTYERLIGSLEKLDKRSTVALAESARLSRERQTDRLVALNSERELVRIRQAIADLGQDLLSAKTELARLMNLKPGTQFSLDLASRPQKYTELDMPLDDVFLIAVTNRSELRKNAYEQRINVKEAQANILALFPSLRPYASGSTSSNSFLINADWASIGMAMSWSLINVFQYPKAKRITKSKQELLQIEALQLTMAVITQVYLANIQYDYIYEKLSIAEKYRSVQKRLTRQMRLEAKASRVSQQELILEEMNELVADARYDIVQAALQRAHSELATSIGVEFNPSLDPGMPLDMLAALLEEEWGAALKRLGTLVEPKAAEIRKVVN